MNGYAQRLLDVAAQLRQLTGRAGSMNNHGSTIEALAHEVETMAVVIEAGLATPARTNVKPNSIPAPLITL